MILYAWDHKKNDRHCMFMFKSLFTEDTVNGKSLYLTWENNETFKRHVLNKSQEKASNAADWENTEDGGGNVKITKKKRSWNLISNTQCFVQDVKILKYETKVGYGAEVNWCMTQWNLTA